MLPLTHGSRSARRELNPRLALIRSRLWPLSYGPMGPEGVEPTPCRLKGGYATITPRPRRRVGRIGLSGYRRTMVFPPQLVRGGIAPPPATYQIAMLLLHHQTKQ